MATVITSPHNKQLVYMNKLKTASGRKTFGQFLAEGKRIVEEAIKAKSATQIVISSDYPYQKIYTNEVIIPSHLFKRYTSTENPQGILAICNKRKEVELEDFAKFTNIICCDNVKDPGNLGMIMRTALALGADCLVLSQGCVDIYNDKVIRASMGAIFKLPVITDVYLLEFLDNLTDLGFDTIALSLKGENIYSQDFANKTALIVGNEAVGIDIRIQQKATARALIPIQGVESLNAGSSVAIAGYELLRRREYGS